MSDISLIFDFIFNTSFYFPVNGHELNKSYLANNNAEISVSDVSTWFQAMTPYNAANKAKDQNKNLADETFETKVANFRILLMKVKEIIDGESLKFVA